MILLNRPQHTLYLSLVWLLTAFIALSVTGCSSTPTVSAEQHPASRYQTPSQAHASSNPHPAIEIALGQLKKPYRYGGVSPRGFDCSGLVYYAYRRSGIEIPRTSLDQYRQSEPVSTTRIQPGDLLFFRIEKKSPSHVGLYVGQGQFIHASTSEKRVTLSQLESPYWRNRLIGAGRYD